MPEPKLYAEYSRQDVHDIFSPDTRFTQSSGSWGLHGIVEIPNKPGDYVFFVTFGQHQADHTFDEWITEEGIISWQSQSRQSFEDRKIQQFIRHDDKNNSIYLFLRTQRSANYTYLGKLKYLVHDPVREKPVYMHWQLTDWPMPAETISRINLKLQPASIFQRGAFQITESAAEYDQRNTTFIWRGMMWQINRQGLFSQVRDWIARGLPEEATRYKDWYVDVDGQRISPKWLFHLITGASYNEFDAPQARKTLAKIGILASRVNNTQEFGSLRHFNSDHEGGDPMNTQERQLYFKKIVNLMSNEFPDILRGADIRVPKRANWFEVRFKGMTGLYSLRLRQTGIEYAYYFSSNTRLAEHITEGVTPHLESLTQQMGYEVNVDPRFNQVWGRFGFDIPTPALDFTYFFRYLSDPNYDRKAEIAEYIADNFPNLGVTPDQILLYLEKYDLSRENAECAWIFLKFIQATHQLLEDIHQNRKSKQRAPQKNLEENDPQTRICAHKIQQIQHFLMGNNTAPSDEVLCDWIHFCYEFELYKEGNMLFTLVSAEDVNPWYYERTRKIARLCSMKTAVRD